MASPRFGKLQTGLARVETLFLPAKRDITGATYTRDDIDRAAAYVALAHAEIQHYIDDRVQELVSKADTSFVARNLLSRELLALMAHNKWDVPPLEFSTLVRMESTTGMPVQAPSDIPPLIRAQAIRAFKNYKDEVRSKNNGIKTSNLLKLLTPLGFAASAFHPSWLAKMDEIGEARGNHVHKSLGSTIIGDPFEALDDVQVALNGSALWTVPAAQISSLASLDAEIDLRLSRL